MKRKFVFLYLNTGGGHISAAKVLQEYLVENKNVESCTLINGFDKKNIFSKLFFEDGYRLSCKAVPGAFSIIYKLGEYRWFMSFLSRLVVGSLAKRLKPKILTNEITDIVSFHYITTPVASLVVKQIEKETGRKIRMSTIVTDPFTVPPVWFFVRKHPIYVFSKQAYDIGIKSGFPKEKLKIVPFLINRKFLNRSTEKEVIELKRKYNLPIDKKIVLLAGGGEGLPHTYKLIYEFLIEKPDFVIMVVCGRDKTTQLNLEILQKMNPMIDLRVFGFVSFMDELIKICDCAVIKAGPATLLEVLKQGKPVIISTHIHGQECGNVSFAVNNQVGWFLQKRKEICSKIYQLFSDSDYYKKVQSQTESFNIDSNANEIVEYLVAE